MFTRLTTVALAMMLGISALLAQEPTRQGSPKVRTGFADGSSLSYNAESSSLPFLS